MDTLIKLPETDTYVVKSEILGAELRKHFGDSYSIHIIYKRDALNNTECPLKAKTLEDARHELICFVNSFNHNG